VAEGARQQRPCAREGDGSAAGVDTHDRRDGVLAQEPSTVPPIASWR